MMDEDNPLDFEISDLELSVRSSNALRGAKIAWVGELVQMSNADILSLRFMGRNSVQEIVEALSFYGLTLEMDVGDWQPPE